MSKIIFFLLFFLFIILAVLLVLIIFFTIALLAFSTKWKKGRSGGHENGSSRRASLERE